jgi:hypothetical protein
MKKVLVWVIVLGIWFAIEHNALWNILDWETAELVGFNMWTLLTLGIACFIAYRLTREKKPSKTTVQSS